MSYQIERLTPSLTGPELRRRIEHLLQTQGPRYRRLWGYFRNPMLAQSSDADSQGSERPYRQAQEWGLPPRITGVAASSGEMLDSQPVDGIARKEIVIENDIAWRIETMIDFLFGKSITITSAAPDAKRRAAIEAMANSILAHNGGITLLQQLALMGAVYGFVDVLVKFDSSGLEAEPSPRPSPVGTGEGEEPATCSQGAKEPAADGAGPSASALAESAPDATACCLSSPANSSTPGASSSSLDVAFEHIARRVRLEIVEPARAPPLLCATDWRTVEGYVQCCTIPTPQRATRAPGKRTWLSTFLDHLAAVRRTALLSTDDEQTLITEILTANHWQRYENEKLVSEGTNSLEILPLVHIQNAAVPFEYSGSSDVEVLIPLQDELNTRLSDRAHRITMQSFKMYLGKGIDNFTSLPVAPGRMWMSDNEGAEVIEFGGDAGAPSEDRHITELREAMDKTSSVTPIAAGAVKGRIGYLTSAAALRVTLSALLAKTARKRITYGEGIVKMCELALAWLDHAGLFPTHPDERKRHINWPSPLPDNETERLEEARLQLALGVPRDTVLRELGY